MAEEIYYQSISELSRQIAAGELPPVELTRIYLERAEKLDRPSFPLPTEPRKEPGDKLASIITLARDHALRAAEEAEREIRSGRIRGPLHGIPYGVKDLLNTRGVRTTWGSKIFADRVPDRDSTVVENLNNAGAVLLGKMAMGEFAGGNTSTALNPWKLDRSTFGSSSGTVVGVTAGLLGFGIGTETGGSIMLPASTCGASGLRPTFGRVSRYGCMALSWSLDKIGSLGRSAIDCGLVLEAIAGHDPKDPTTSEKVFRFRPDPGRIAGRKVGIHRPEFERVPFEWDRSVFARALDVLKQLGLVLEDITLPADRPYGAIFSITTATEAGTSFKHLFEDGRLAGMFELNASRRANWMAASMSPASDYLTAQRIRQMIKMETDELMSGYDALVVPTWPTGAPMRETVDGWPVPARTPPARPRPRGRTARVNSIANLCGLPGITVPCGFDDTGMPLSIQIVSGAWKEQSALDIAMAFQKETDWHERRPSYPFRA